MGVNNSVAWCEKDTFEASARSLIRPASVVLDIGCGIRPQRFVVPDVAICVEPHREYIDYLKKSIDSANILIIPLGALEALGSLPDRSVDSIFMVDVIEHMPKSIGLKVLSECLRVARAQVIVFTPLGYMPQSVHADELDGWGLNGGVYQDHKSGWYIEDFPGWDIVACNNLHSVDHRGAPIDPPYGGFYAIKNISQVADLFNPMHAEGLIKKSLAGLSEAPLFGEYVKSFVVRELGRINNRCAIKSSLLAAEQLSKGLGKEEIEGFFSDIKSEKYQLFSEEAAEFSERVTAFGNLIFGFCARESDLLAREKICSDRERLLAEEKSKHLRDVADFNSRRLVRLIVSLRKIFS